MATITSLLRNAASIRDQLAAYQDAIKNFEYSNSAYTDDALVSYSDYLKSRISGLNASNSITDASKALTLTRTLDSATKQNISSTIQRENIQVMSGNASLTDKYNVIARQYVRAFTNGDYTLAQGLMGQAYSLSQTIQLQAQAAADAGAALQKASQTSAVTHQTDIITSLDYGLKQFQGIAKNASQKELNKALGDYVKNNGETFKALGVIIPQGAQPNYWDVVQGITGAKYNALVLKAQAEVPIDPAAAANFARAAQFLNEGVTKIQTLGGSLTLQEVQQAAQDPAMFAYNNATGSYSRTTQIGYHHQTYTDANGNQQSALAPTYSGIAGAKDASKIYFLTPDETKLATKLGLNFTNDQLNKNGTVGTGVQVQLSENSPKWLKDILGQNGITKLFTDDNGQITFKGVSKTGEGESYYTLTHDGNGLAGLFEHTAAGVTALAGGDYGFNASSSALLQSAAQQQKTIELQKQTALANIAPAPMAPLPSLHVAAPAPTPSISVPKFSAPAIAPPTVNPQAGAKSPQQPAGINLQGGGGIRLQ